MEHSTKQQNAIKKTKGESKKKVIARNFQQVASNDDTEDVDDSSASGNASSLNNTSTTSSASSSSSTSSPSSHPANANERENWKTMAGVAVCAVAGCTVAVAATPFVIGAMGFSSGGIVSGTIASTLMSWTASVGGGGVATGSLVATLQSVGAAGLGLGGSVAVGGAGAAVGGVGGGIAANFVSNRSHKKDDHNGKAKPRAHIGALPPSLDDDDDDDDDDNDDDNDEEEASSFTSRGTQSTLFCNLEDTTDNLPSNRNVGTQSIYNRGKNDNERDKDRRDEKNNVDSDEEEFCDCDGGISAQEIHTNFRTCQAPVCTVACQTEK